MLLVIPTVYTVIPYNDNAAQFATNKSAFEKINSDYLGAHQWCNTDEPRQTLLVSKYQCCPLQDLTDKDCSFSALYLKITLFVAQILAFIDLDSTGRIALTASNQRKKLSFGVVSSRRSI